MIQDDDHLLEVLRYVEANPRRAGLVADYRRIGLAVLSFRNDPGGWDRVA